ncbi:MAG: LysR family transcriptional regulator [Myxococcota bacterium]
MHVDILGLEAFLAIAEHGRFTPAARALHITQTALTRRLQQFEADLGVALVERTTRSVGLTPVGERFLPRARRLLGELRASLVELRETGRAERGDVAIACVPTVGVQYLPRVIQAYAREYPENRVQILDHASAHVIEAVRRREVEFGIAIAGALPTELESKPLLEDRFVLICRRDHPLAERKRLAWRKLTGHPLVFVGSASGNRPLLEAALTDAPPRLDVQYEVQRSSTAVGLAAAGVAAAIVPALAVQAGAHPKLRVVPLVEPVVSRSLVLVTRKGGELSPAAAALFARLRRGI